jgi:peptidoglycan-associated lipoprotein
MKKLAVLLSALLFVACSSTKPTPTPVTESAPTSNSNSTATAAPAPAVAVAPALTTSASPGDTAATAKLADEIQKIQPGADAASAANLANEIMKLHKQSVYFDFDEYALKPEFRSIVEMQAATFKSRKNTMLVLEGNADERGSAAYNLALGERRATSVKKALVTMGVPALKIKVVSYGNTRPKLSCHEEKCWQENRRVDFVFNQQ